MKQITNTDKQFFIPNEVIANKIYHVRGKLDRDLAEADSMVSQNAIPSRQHLGDSLPYAFTEHGVLQLSNVLKSGQAVQVSINIIEVFIKIRELLLTNKDILLQLNQIRTSLNEHEDRIDMIYNYLKQFMQDQKKPRTEVGYKK